MRPHRSMVVCLLALLAPSVGCSRDGSPDGRAARWALQSGGFVEIQGEGDPVRVASAKELPPPITVLKIGWLSYPGDQFPEITDDSLENLEGLPNLVWLDLSGTGITDAGLAHVGDLKGLKELHLNHTDVGDEGLMHLYELDQLEIVGLEGTQVSEKGRRELREKRPGIKFAN